MDTARAVDVIYLNFSRVFDIASNNVLVAKLERCGLDGWTTRKVKFG